MPLPRIPAGRRLAAVLLAGGAIACVLALAPRGFALRLIASHGFFEDVCVTGYLAGAAILADTAWRRRRGAPAEGALLLVLFTAAELDLTGILTRVEERPRILLDPAVPLGQRGIAVLFLAAAAGLGVRFVTRRRRGYLAALRAGEPAAWLASAGAILVAAGVVLAQVQTLFPWQAGYRAYKGVLFGLSVAEEMVELCAPYLFLLAAGAWRGEWYDGGRGFRRSGANNPTRRRF